MSLQQELIRRLQPQADFVSRGSGRGHKGGRKSGTIIFLAGQSVPESGIYKVIHHQDHRPAHEAVMHRGDVLPACDQCQEKVRFQVLYTAPYIFDDEDFVEE